MQRAKKVVSDSPGLVDFATGLVISIVTLSQRVFACSSANSNYRRTVTNAHQKFLFRLIEKTFGLVRTSYSLPERQAVKLTFFAPCNVHFPGA